MTCDPISTTLEGFLQGIMRERKFVSFQQMDDVASDSIGEHASSTLCAALIERFIKNSSTYTSPEDTGNHLPAKGEDRDLHRRQTNALAEKTISMNLRNLMSIPGNFCHPSSYSMWINFNVKS
jgi:hypothetical protein